LRGVAPMVSSYVLAEDDVQVFTLDQSRLEAHPNVQQIAELSRQPPPETEPGDEKPLPSAAKRTSRRCLVYTAGRRQTSDLTQVLSILELPKHVTPLQSTAPSVEGLFSHLGASVLLVDLTKACGATAKRDPAQARVLLVRGPSGDVGFLVDSVDGVENSDLVIAEKGDPIGPVAQLGQAEHRVALPFVDLHEVAAGLSPHS
ncbi:MAG: chemotaxis protein CheW, partial [Pseudomonadota bacterium]